MTTKRPRVHLVNSMTECLAAFRGIATVQEAREEHSRSGCTFRIVADYHGKRFMVHRRTDGVLFVNCAGRTAIVSRNVLLMQRQVIAALRG